MERLSEIHESRRPKVEKILQKLSTGEWESWNAGKKSGFKSWIEDEGGRKIFTFYFSELNLLLIWTRKWSVNLLGRVKEKYPSGIYESSSELPFKPHIIISVSEETEKPESDYFFEKKNYVEKNGLNQERAFHELEPQEQLAYGEELYILSKSKIGDLLSGVQKGLPLHMSEEQVEALEASEGPYLVSGAAGSGKTIVIIHWLMINLLKSRDKGGQEPPEQLFATFNERLRNKAYEEFHKMLPKDSQNPRVRFLAYWNLLDEIVKSAGIQEKFPEDKEMTFERFMEDFSWTVQVKEVDPVLLWDEIRSVIKGSVQAKSQNLIELSEYEKLGKDWCKTPESLRKKYYEEAERYQEHLREERMWDELDLVKECLSHLEEAPKFEKIACDEAQDLAPIEVMLLVRLLENQDISNLFLTGDRAQVVNPSGFRWGKIKWLLYGENPEKRIPDPYILRRNYRSSKEIVRLVNSVLSVRRGLLRDTISKLHQTPLKTGGINPVTLTEHPLDVLTEGYSNPNQSLVLVKTPEEKEMLNDELGNAAESVTLLTVEEAKGLQYSRVLLWNFFTPRHAQITENDWKKVFIPEKRRKLKEDIKTASIIPYALSYEFNLLHVGLTRARQRLFVYDKDAQMALPRLVEETNGDFLRLDNDSFADWWEKDKPVVAEDEREAGERLLKRDTKQARIHLKLAADKFKEEKDFTSAGECLEKAELFEEAADVYATAGKEEKKLEMKGFQFEKRGKWHEAGESFRELGNKRVELGKGLNASESFMKAEEFYKGAGEKELATDVALKSAECLPPEANRRKAIRFADAAEVARTCSIKKAIKALEDAISEAIEARNKGEEYIYAQPINIWIADTYNKIAHLSKELGDFKKGGSSAKKAAGHFKGDSKYQSYRESLRLSVELYIEAGEILKSEKIRGKLGKAVKPSTERGKIQTKIHDIEDWWEHFANSYAEKDEMENYAETILELSDLLSERNQQKDAFRHLQNAKERCLEDNRTQIAEKLIKRYIQIAEDSRKWPKAASGYESYAELCRAEEEFEKAGGYYLEAGGVNLKIGETSSAGEFFRQGENLYSKTLIENRRKLGWYCFRDVALDNYLSAQHYQLAAEWVKKSASYFNQERQDSLKELRGLRKRKKEVGDLNSCGWVQLCIACIYGELSRIGGSSESAKKRFEKAKRFFEDGDDPEAKRIAEKIEKSYYQ